MASPNTSLWQAQLSGELNEEVQEKPFPDGEPASENHFWRNARVRRPRIYCAAYRCSHSIAISAEHWPDDLRLSDIAPRFVRQACGKRGTDVRLDFNGGRQPAR